MKKRHTLRQDMKESASDQERRSDIGDERCRLITVKAYELYERRGRADGHDLDDWYKAEAIVNGWTNETGT